MGAGVEAVDAPPPEGTVERWCFEFVGATTLEAKLSPPPPPARFLEPARRFELARPGRPPELVARSGRRKTPRPGALRDPVKRAELLHTFLHHELQAAELMAWAILSFPDTPEPFRRGLLGICGDELRHVRMYREHLGRLGCPVGHFPINDWFWERVPGSARSPAHFVAGLGVGFEGGNLDHGARYAGHLGAAGDPRAAAIQARIVEEEIPHAAFALHWFRVFTGGLDFEVWRAHLPAPLSPMMARGNTLNLEARRRAGFPEPFLAALDAWSAAPVAHADG